MPAPSNPGPLSADEQSLLDRAKALLQQCALEERARSASGRLGVTISIRNGRLEFNVKPRRYVDAS